MSIDWLTFVSELRERLSNAPPLTAPESVKGPHGDRIAIAYHEGGSYVKLSGFEVRPRDNRLVPIVVEVARGVKVPLTELEVEL
jgi:hypothetical protein